MAAKNIAAREFDSLPRDFSAYGIMPGFPAFRPKNLLDLASTSFYITVQETDSPNPG